MRRAAAVALTLGAWIVLGGGSRAYPSEAISAIVAGRADLVALYRPGGFEPLWLDRGIAPSASAREALAILAAADADGLDPEDYAVSTLTALARELEGGAAPPDAPIRFDTQLSDQVLRYLRELRTGRVDPRSLGLKLRAADNDHQFAAVVLDALARRRVAAALREWAPRDPAYSALVAALARYRALVTREPSRTPPVPATSIRPGDHYADLDLLQARLQLLGDLAPGAAPGSDDLYAGPIVEGVVRFQARHGLDADGVFGRRTAEQMAVPLAWRVRQLELALERLRWLPHEGDQRLIVVNIPMFRLFAWDRIPPPGPPAFTTAVIVGRAVATETPVFTAVLTEILFRPFWNVPASIVRKEILPAMAREPNYLQQQHMELVAGQRDDSPVVEDTPENRVRLQSGAVRLRQRPGPENALGTIKFSFPNEDDVYMHATPAPTLFARSRRDFSHGCVRVQDPVGLAAWVLQEQEGWDRTAITMAMNAPRSSKVPVRRPTRVLLEYSTAAVDLSTGAILFADDIYGHDARLDRALRTRRSR